MQRPQQDGRLPEDLLRLVQPVREVQASSQDLGEKVHGPALSLPTLICAPASIMRAYHARDFKGLVVIMLINLLE